MKTYNTSSSSYWHKDAKQFAKLYYNSLIISPEIFIKKFLSQRTIVLKKITPVGKNLTLLDLGCGSGEHIRELISKYKFVYGVDYSKQMLNLAKKELTGLSSKKYKLIQADAANLPLPKKTVDVIIAMGLFDYVKSPEEVLKECNRVLKPNGILVLSMPKSPSIFSFLRTSFGITLRKIIFNLPPIRNTMTKAEIKQFLKSCGFSQENISPVWDAMWMTSAKKDKS